MTNHKDRPPLDAVITEALTKVLVPSGLPEAVPIGEIEIDDEFVIGLASSSGYKKEEIVRRIDYFIDEGVLRRRATANGKSRTVSFVDLDMEAKRLGVSQWFTGAKKK